MEIARRVLIEEVLVQQEETLLQEEVHQTLEIIMLVQEDLHLTEHHRQEHHRQEVHPLITAEHHRHLIEARDLHLLEVVAHQVEVQVQEDQVADLPLKEEINLLFLSQIPTK
jgi:hypothetical protein